MSCARAALPPARPCCDAVGAANDPEWTVSAARDAALGVVGVSNLAGDSLGSGFWITTSCVCTAWDVVSGQAGGVRVIVPVSYGPPMLVDALFIFGAQEYGLALLEVQPALLPPGYLPSILPLASARVLVGQSVYALANASATTFGAFAAGSVRDVTFSVYGDVSYLTLDLALGFAAGGAPVLRRCDGAVIGVALYYRYAPGDMIVAASGSTLSAFLTLAGRASIDLGLAASGVGHQTLPVLTTPARLIGATTFPTLSDTPTLGTVIEYTIGQAAFNTTLPCMTDSISPQALVVGDTATGMWAYDPTLSTIESDFRFGTLLDDDSGHGLFTDSARLTLSGLDSFAYACDQNFTRLRDVPVVDITTLSSVLPNIIVVPTLTMDPLDAVCLIESYPDLFDPSAFDLIAYTTDMYGRTINANSIAVYAAGLVVFRNNAITPLDGIDGLETFITQAYPVLPINTQPILAPFASTDFIYRGNSNDNVGQPGYALQVSAMRDNTVVPNRLTIQWKGFSQVTGDPVLFQLMMTITQPSEAFDILSGQMLCTYGTMPGTWAGGPWLTASTLTVNWGHLYTDGELPAVRPPFVQLLRVYDPPVQNEAIYFGRAAGQASLAMARPIAPAPLETRFLVPWRTPGGDLPAYDTLTDDVLNAPYAQGTTALLWLDADGNLLFEYAISGWEYNPAPLRVAAVGSKAIGATNTNVDSLLDAIVALRAVNATQRAPVLLSSLSLSQLVNGSLCVLSASAIASLISSARLMGAPGASVDLSNLSSLTFGFTPAPGVAPVYSATVMTLPTQNCGGLLPNIVAASITIVIDVSDIPAPIATPLAIVQLAAADSTSLVTTLEPDTADGLSAVVIYYSDGQFFFSLRNGAGTSPIDHPAVQVTPVDGILTVSVTLEAPQNPENSAQRPNAIVTGRPPRANNQFTGGTAVQSGTLVPVAVAITAVTTTTLARVSARDTERTWAITSAPPQPVPYEYPGTFNVLYPFNVSVDQTGDLSNFSIRYLEASPALIPLGTVPVAFNTFAQTPLFQYIQ
jgi:hypothetical protein